MQLRNRTHHALRGAALGTALALAVGVGPVAASPASTTVNLVACAFGGGAIVPAGTPVDLRFVWDADTSGQIRDFLGAVAMTVSIDGVPVGTPTRYFSRPSNTVVAPLWTTVWFDPAGLVLTNGQTLTVTFDVVVSHRVVGPRDPDTNRQTKSGPGSVFGGPVTCSISGS